MKLYVFWGETPSSFPPLVYRNSIDYPEMFHDYDPKYSRPRHPKTIEKYIREYVEREYAKPADNDIFFIRTYSELVIDIIRVLAKKALHGNDGIQFPHYDEITFVVPNEERDGYEEIGLDEHSMIDYWPPGFCDTHEKIRMQLI